MFRIGILTLALAASLSQVPTPSSSSQDRAESGETLTRFQAISRSRGRVVLHFGQDVRHLQSALLILQQSNIPAVTYAGGERGTVSLFVNLKSYGSFDNDEIAGGMLNDESEKAYCREMRVEVGSARPC